MCIRDRPHFAVEEAERGIPGEEGASPSITGEVLALTVVKEATSTSVSGQVVTPHFAVDEAEEGFPGKEDASPSITGEIPTLTVAKETAPSSVTCQTTTSAVTGEEAAPPGIASEGTCPDTRTGEEDQPSSFAATGYTSPESLGVAETSKSGQAKEPFTVACSPTEEPSSLAHPGSVRKQPRDGRGGETPRRVCTCLLYTSPSPRD